MSNSKKRGLVIGIEGMWCVGKTTLCNDFNKMPCFVCVKEPSYLLAGQKFKNIKEINDWYFWEHHKRMSHAKDLAMRGKNVVLDRTILSSLAFLSTYDSRSIAISYLKKINLLVKPDFIIYLKRDMKEVKKEMKKYKPIEEFANEKFLKKLHQNFIFFLKLLKWKYFIMEFRD